DRRASGMRQNWERSHILLSAPRDTASVMNFRSVSSDSPSQKNQPCSDLLPLKTTAAKGAIFAKCQITAACWRRSPRSASIIWYRRGPVLANECCERRPLFVRPVSLTIGDGTIKE